MPSSRSSKVYFSLAVLLGGLAMGGTADAQSGLPACPANQSVRYYNCWGTYTYPNGEKYVGAFKDGKREGRGTLTWPDGGKYLGAWKDGKREGRGTYSFPDGRKYEGAWKDSKPNGQGTHTYSDGAKYEGAFKDGKREGRGTYSFPDGGKYEGAWKDGKPNGQGLHTYSDGAKYVGAYKDDKREGQGTFTWPDGRKYEGTWKDGKFEGQGTLTFPDGRKYEGAFKDSKYEGQGTRTFPNGAKHVGAFKDGKREGQGTLTFPDGRTCVGAWKNDKFEGQGTCAFPDGAKLVGQFKDDKAEGQGALTFPDGEKYEGAFKDGKREGQGTLSLPNGEKYVGAHKNDKAEGQGTLSLPDGRKYEGAWKVSKPNGQGTYTYSDGAKYEGAWKDGKREGQGILTLPNGATYVGAWKDGKREGQGTLTSFGAEYVGTWREDKLEGYGTFTIPGVGKYVGAFKGNKQEGQGTQTFPDGMKYEGAWKDGKYEGQGTYTYSNGAKYEGAWKDGKREGRGTYTYPDGWTYVGAWKDGKREGQGTLALPSGTKFVGIWADDKYIRSAPVPTPEADVPTLQQPNSRGGLESPPLSTQLAEPAIAPFIAPMRQRIDEYIWSAPVPIPEVDVPTLQQPNSNRGLGSPPLSAQLAKPAIAPPIVPGRQRAAMLVQQSVNDKQNITTYVGNSLWRLVPSQRPGSANQQAIRADVNLPEIALRLTLTIEKNTDMTLRASHVITIRFMQDPDAKFLAVAELGAPQMRDESTSAVDALASVYQKITENIFIIALTDETGGAARNIETIKTRGWFDFPLRIADGRIGKITVEKGAYGDKLIKEALLAWHGTASASFFPEPRRVQTLPVRPDGTIVGDPPDAARMSPSQWIALDSFLQAQYQRCWTLVPESGGTPHYVPQLEVHYLAAGGLAREPKLRNPPSDPALMPLAESALHAVKKCDPLSFPRQFQPFFSEWKSRILRFDQKEMIR